MERYPNEVHIDVLEEEVRVSVAPYLNREMATEYYVYGLDTNDGRIAAAWRCPSEQTAKRVYQETIQQMDGEHLTGQFQFGYLGIASGTAIEYVQGGLRKVGFFKQEDFAFAASLTKKPVLLAKEHHCIANDLSGFMLCAGMLLEEFTAPDRSSKPICESYAPTAIPSIETLSEETTRDCFALVFDSDIDRKISANVRAVVAIGKLTDEQYRRLPGEFTKRYTGTKCVNFVLEGTLHARILSDIPKDVLCYTSDELSEQDKAPDYLKMIFETLVAIQDAIQENTAAVKENTAKRENDVFHGTFRARARFSEPDDEIEIEKIIRLKSDGWKWENIVLQIRPDSDKLPKEEFNKLVDAIKKQYQRELEQSATKKPCEGWASLQ